MPIPEHFRQPRHTELLVLAAEVNTVRLKAAAAAASIHPADRTWRRKEETDALAHVRIKLHEAHEIMKALTTPPAKETKA